jgi:hypothetical protein
MWYCLVLGGDGVDRWEDEEMRGDWRDKKEGGGFKKGGEPKIREYNKIMLNMGLYTYVTE